MLVLGAGTLGTNEILLRSREAGGLAVSDSLGQGFSANGNHLWLVDYQQAVTSLRKAMYTIIDENDIVLARRD